MDAFFISNRKPLEIEVLKLITQNKQAWSKTHPWAEDVLSKLEKFVLPGKMLRGLLVLLAAEGISKFAVQDSLRVGAAIELIHSGLLIHDDIMDRDNLRRGQLTIHTQYAKQLKKAESLEALHYGESMASSAAIATYFIALNCFAKLNHTKSIQKLQQLFSEELAMVALAQMEDVHNSTVVTKDGEQSVMRIYEQKTGRYTFALPIMAGLLLQDKLTTQVQKIVLNLAKHLGVVFQLRDDCLSVFGDSHQTGKSVGGDIREKKQTWLYFQLLKKLNVKQAQQIRSWYTASKSLNQTQVKTILNLMKEYQIEHLAFQEIKKHQAMAVQDVGKLPLKQSTKNKLLSLIEFLVIRDK